MKFRNKLVLLMILATIHLPCAGYAADEDKELALIAAEQERSGDDEQIDEINPALTDTITTERTQETEKEIRERKKKLEHTRKEKEKDNNRKLRESTTRNEKVNNEESTIVIDPNELPKHVKEPPPPIPEQEPVITPVPPPQPQTVETVAMPDQKIIYSNFSEVARAVRFIPLYMPRKSGYEISALYAGQGIAEIRYGRRWEPTVSLTVRTHKRADGEAPQDISGVTGVKWRVDTTTGTTIYIAKISDTQQVAAWAVGHYTFSAQAENLSYAGFHSLVADELVELSTHYYLDF